MQNLTNLLTNCWMREVTLLTAITLLLNIFVELSCGEPDIVVTVSLW